MSQKKFDHQPPTYTYFLNISKKEEKRNTEMSSAGKKIEYSLTFLLFKEKKCFLPPHHLASKKFIHQFFSLFLKNGKNAN